MKQFSKAGGDQDVGKKRETRNSFRTGQYHYYEEADITT